MPEREPEPEVPKPEQQPEKPTPRQNRPRVISSFFKGFFSLFWDVVGIKAGQTMTDHLLAVEKKGRFLASASVIFIFCLGLGSTLRGFYDESKIHSSDDSARSNDALAKSYKYQLDAANSTIINLKVDANEKIREKDTEIAKLATENNSLKIRLDQRVPSEEATLSAASKVLSEIKDLQKKNEFVTDVGSIEKGLPVEKKLPSPFSLTNLTGINFVDPIKVYIPSLPAGIKYDVESVLYISNSNTNLSYSLWLVATDNDDRQNRVAIWSGYAYVETDVKTNTIRIEGRGSPTDPTILIESPHAKVRFAFTNMLISDRSFIMPSVQESGDQNVTFGTNSYMKYAQFSKNTP